MLLIFNVVVGATLIIKSDMPFIGVILIIGSAMIALAERQ